MVQHAQNPVTASGTGADSQNQAGKWYMITWSWEERHYYDENSEWDESEVVFMPPGGSIAKYILNKYKQYVLDGTIYTQEERGLDGWGVGCGLSSLVLLTPDGKKISGFKPKSIAFLCGWKD